MPPTFFWMVMSLAAVPLLDTIRLTTCRCSDAAGAATMLVVVAVVILPWPSSAVLSLAEILLNATCQSTDVAAEVMSSIE